MTRQSWLVGLSGTSQGDVVIDSVGVKLHEETSHVFLLLLAFMACTHTII